MHLHKMQNLLQQSISTDHFIIAATTDRSSSKRCVPLPGTKAGSCIRLAILPRDAMPQLHSSTAYIRSLPLVLRAPSTHLQFRSSRSQQNSLVANMAPSRHPVTPLSKFLQNTRPPFSTPIHVVLGNEAADVDSLFCAIALAYAWQVTSDKPTVPIANLKRSDLPLRRDVLAVFHLADLQPEDVLFLDDFEASLERVLEECHGQITLVDHNEVAPGQGMLERYVCGIVDHHVDSGKHHDANPRIVETVGSCSTLVAELLASSHGLPLDQVARLLICAILLDTGNLSPSMGKTTPRDEAALCMLRDIAGWNEEKCADLYKLLQAARSDVEGFSAYMLLKKDLKVFTAGGQSVAIASIQSSPQSLVALACQGDEGELDKCVSEIAKELGVDSVLLLLRHEESGVFQRNLAIMKGSLGDELQSILLDSNGHFEDGKPFFRVTRREVDNSLGLWWFHVNDAKVSRKVVAPVILKVLESLEKATANAP